MDAAKSVYRMTCYSGSVSMCSHYIFWFGVDWWSHSAVSSQCNWSEVIFPERRSSVFNYCRSVYLTDFTYLFLSFYNSIPWCGLHVLNSIRVFLPHTEKFMSDSATDEGVEATAEIVSYWLLYIQEYLVNIKLYIIHINVLVYHLYRAVCSL